MTATIGRRELLAALGGAAAAWPKINDMGRVASVAACARRAPPPAPGAALLGQHTRGVVSLHLRTSRGRGV